MRQAISLQAGFAAPARGPRQRARAAGALRGGGALLRAGDPARAAAAARAQEARSGARRARPRPGGRRVLRGVLRAGSRPRQGRSWRSITCGRAARTRLSTRCARRCARTRTTSMRCASSRSSTGARTSSCRTPKRCCDESTQLAPGHTMAWTLLGAHAAGIGPARGSDGVLPDGDPDSTPPTPSPGRDSGRPFARRRRGEGASRHSNARSHCSPATPNVQLSYGHALKTRGDQAAALRAYRAAIAAKPDFGEVYWSMANLKVFRFEDAEIARHGGAGRRATT